MDTTFRMELDLRSVVGELPESLELETASELTQPHEFPEIEECIKEHTTKDGSSIGGISAERRIARNSFA